MINNYKIARFLKIIADLEDQPNNEDFLAEDIKEYFDSSPEELRVALNALIDNLKATANNDSGADNIGATTINGLTGNTVQALLESLGIKNEELDQRVTDEITNLNNELSNTISNNYDILNQNKANKSEVYTKDQIDPFLRGGDTVIKYEVFTIVTSSNDDGTFTYKNSDNTLITNNLTPEGYQVFTLTKGSYILNLNRIECSINDTLQRSVASGGLQEIDTTHIALTMPEGSGAEITFKYFERIGLVGNGLIAVSETNPSGGFMWFKVVG